MEHQVKKMDKNLPYKEHVIESRQIAVEGMVLLKNIDNVLPLKSNKIALFGAGAVDTVFCGTGSGYVCTPHMVNVLEGLENAGFNITSKSWLNRFEAISKKINEEDETLTYIDRIWGGKKILIDDVPISEEEIIKAQEADTAIYVIRRNAGEDKDRQAVKGDYYLSEVEENNINLITKKFVNTIIVLNTCVIDATFIKDIPEIKAAILMGLAGSECGNALADLLTGKCNPSGKLTDSWTYKYEDNPASKTFASNDGNSLQEDYVEDIFVGYRYFDSFGVEPLFPFGYGLSYTTFDIVAQKIKVTWEEVVIEVAVKNTGNIPGKEVIQVYSTAPEGKLAKPFQELRAYTKTKLLQPGELELLSLKFKTEDLASYDESIAAFIMEQGKYILRIGNSSRNTKIEAYINLDKTAVVRQVSNKCQIDKELECFKAPSRAKLKLMLSDNSTLSKLLVEPCDRVMSVDLRADDCETIDGASQFIEADNINKRRFSGVKPAVNATLLDVGEGKVSLDEFVTSLEPEVLVRLVTGVANETTYETKDRLHRKLAEIGGPNSSGATTSLFISTLGIPNWKVTDGPAGCHLAENPATCFPTDIVVAQTWNIDLAIREGKGIGKELAYYNQSVILGPGMNIHRDPLCGRNFEYFSEDPLVSGCAAAGITKGVQMIEGASVSIKHFACNNQETDRFVTNSTVSERALREIYLKGFEICIRNAKPNTVMSSYNKLNGIHTSSNYQLLTDILRGEWGFDGLVMTDWGTHSDKAEDLHAGNDLIMGGYWTDDLIAALEGTKPEFSDDGYVVVKEFPIYGGFATEIVERWNAFKLSSKGTDTITTLVCKDKELNQKVSEKVKLGEARIKTLDDGSKEVTYIGTNRGAYLDIDDLRACAANVLKQILKSVSYKKLMEQL